MTIEKAMRVLESARKELECCSYWKAFDKAWEASEYAIAFLRDEVPNAATQDFGLWGGGPGIGVLLSSLRPAERPPGDFIEAASTYFDRQRKSVLLVGCHSEEFAERAEDVARAIDVAAGIIEHCRAVRSSPLN